MVVYNIFFFAMLVSHIFRGIYHTYTGKIPKGPRKNKARLAAMKTQPPPKSERVAVPQNRPDLSYARSQEGLKVQEKFSNFNQNEPSRQSKRPEMKGPTDISDILSGIKTKQINVQDSTSEKEHSTISIQDLKELTNSKMPKAGKKGKPRSERNTISLDI